MGCGQSAWDDEIEEQEWQEKLTKVSNLTQKTLINKLDSIEELVRKVNKETASGSRYLFELLDHLLKESNWKKWE